MVRTMQSLRRAALAALLALVPAAAWATTRGPDAGGYMATDSVVYSFVDISGSGGASVLAGTDDGTAVLTLPFPFLFYGHSYSMVCVSSNGALYFVANAGACAGFNDFANTDLTSTAPPNDAPGVFPFWSDLTFQIGAGAVVYQTLGTPGSRRFVVQWDNAYPQGSPNPVTFQVILSEAGGRIVFQYKTVALGPGNPASLGRQATIGIRNTAALTTNELIGWSFGAPVVSDSTALQFSAGDTSAPVITAAAAPSQLWPPNGKPVSVTVTGTITDGGTGVDLGSATFVVGDEYLEAQPSGSITVAPNGAYSVTLSLIASRHGNDQDGRTYTIVVRAKDLAGNSGSAAVVVTVPHDQKNQE